MAMRSLFYFHGLQSKQGGQKVDFLTRYFLVHAPLMIYKQSATWPNTIQKVNKTKPQFIVGSSLGGLMSFYTAYNLKCRMLLFNPAFDRIPEYINNWTCNHQDQLAQVQIVLGNNDKDVDPHKTIKYLQQNKIRANITWLDIEHRIPYQVFCEQFQRVFGKQINSIS